MGEVPRHRFVPEDFRHMAYEDTPLPIGHGQTISPALYCGSDDESSGRGTRQNEFWRRERPIDMDLGLILLQVVALFMALTFHEFAHGWVARRLGDRTAEAQGRLTLNPKDHIDPFGTILLPAMLILIKSPVVFGMGQAGSHQSEKFQGFHDGGMMWSAPGRPSDQSLFGSRSDASSKDDDGLWPFRSWSLSLSDHRHSAECFFWRSSTSSPFPRWTAAA